MANALVNNGVAPRNFRMVNTRSFELDYALAVDYDTPRNSLQ